MKVPYIRYNLFAGTETLSLSVYDPIAIQYKFWLGGPSPNLGGRDRVRGSNVVPVKAHHTGHNLLIETDTLSLFV